MSSTSIPRHPSKTAHAARSVRRLRLELDLATSPLQAVPLPGGFQWGPWRKDRSFAHAAVLFEGFRDQVDSRILPSLATLAGCGEVVDSTARDFRFVPEASWLVLAPSTTSGLESPCGAIQVLATETSGLARIQNVAVLPDYRGRRIGRALITRALRSCRQLGFQRIQLDVTAANRVAATLYRSLGFRLRRSYLCVRDDEGLSPIV
jgi:GNAT superfamily N-acetyltransferase